MKSRHQELLLVISVIIGLLFLVYYRNSNRYKDDFELLQSPEYVYDESIGERPPIGDYLPTEGNTYTGSGGFALEDEIP